MNKHFFKLFIAQFLWAGNLIVSQLAIEKSVPLFILFLRFFLTSIIYIGLLTQSKKTYLWKKEELKKISLHSWSWLFLTGFIGVSLYFTFTYLGIAKSNATRAGLIIPTLQPLFAVVLGRLILKETISLKILLGLIIALIGALLVIFPSEIKLNEDAMYGNLFLIAASLCYAFFSIGLRVVSLRVDSLKTIALFSFIASLILIPMPYLAGEKITLEQVSNPSFFILLAYFLLSTVLPYFWWNAALKDIGVVRTAIFTFLIAPLAILQAYFILGQSPSFREGLGGSIILIGVFFSKYLKIGKSKNLK